MGRTTVITLLNHKGFVYLNTRCYSGVTVIQIEVEHFVVVEFFDQLFVTFTISTIHKQLRQDHSMRDFSTNNLRLTQIRHVEQIPAAAERSDDF